MSAQMKPVNRSIRLILACPLEDIIIIPSNSYGEKSLALFFNCKHQTESSSSFVLLLGLEHVKQWVNPCRRKGE